MSQSTEKLHVQTIMYGTLHLLIDLLMYVVDRYLSH
jgi:hypothetical protein